MRARKMQGCGWLALLGLALAGLIWIGPAVSLAQEEEEPGLVLGEPGPPGQHPMPGKDREGPRGRRIFQPEDRLLRGGPGGRRFDEALERMKTENPERFQRITKIRELGDEYRAAGNAEAKKKIEKELRPLLETELKAVQAENQKKIEELEKRLSEEKRKQKEREQNWAAYLDFQFKRITGQADYLQLPIGPWK